jgi:type I restriction enzyme S subunit
MIDITPYQFDIVINILKKHVPHCEVRVFGSRYKWTSKNYSDLDLVVVGSTKLDKKTLYDLKEDFSESDLPIRVDVLDWHAISEEFKQVINQGYEVIQKKQLPDGWYMSTIKEETTVITDFVSNGSFASLAKNVNYKTTPDYAILIRLTDYKNNYRNNLVYVDKHAYDFLKKSKLYGGEIIISNVGAYAGTVFLTPNLKVPMTLGPNAIMVNFKNENKFYYYWFKSSIGRLSLNRIISGSAQSKFNKTSFRKLFIPVPPIEEQKEIASILSALDEKININKQINSKLEEIAQTLFKQWFIDFNFPDENGFPYKDSDGIMIDSELGKIPKGWEIINLDDYLDFIRGVEPGSKNYASCKISDEYIQFIRVSDLQSLGNTYIHKSLAKDKFVNEDNVLISLDGTIGRVKIGLYGSYSSGIRKVVNKILNKNIFKFSNQFIYFLLQTENIQNIIIANATGTTILHAGHTIKLLKIVIDNEILNKFNKIILPLYQQLINNYKEITILQQIRDLLLPKLMSGEINVR